MQTSPRTLLAQLRFTTGKMCICVTSRKNTPITGTRTMKRSKSVSDPRLPSYTLHPSKLPCKLIPAVITISKVIVNNSIVCTAEWCGKWIEVFFGTQLLFLFVEESQVLWRVFWLLKHEELAKELQLTLMDHIDTCTSITSHSQSISWEKSVNNWILMRSSIRMIGEINCSELEYCVEYHYCTITGLSWAELGMLRIRTWIWMTVTLQPSIFTACYHTACHLDTSKLNLFPTHSLTLDNS